MTLFTQDFVGQWIESVKFTMSLTLLDKREILFLMFVEHFTENNSENSMKLL